MKEQNTINNTETRKISFLRFDSPEWQPRYFCCEEDLLLFFKAVQANHWQLKDELQKRWVKRIDGVETEMTPEEIEKYWNLALQLKEEK